MEKKLPEMIKEEWDVKEKAVSVTLLVALVVLLLTSCGSGVVEQVESDASPELEYASFEELAGLSIGVLTGSAQPQLVSAVIPTAELVYLNGSSDLYQALKTHKVDAYAEDEVIIQLMSADDDSVSWIPAYLDTSKFAFAFTKDKQGEALCSEMNEFVQSMYEDGTIDELKEIWTGSDEERKQPSGYESLPAVNGTIHAAVDSESMPMVYVKDNAIVGFEIDLLARFCAARGYALEIEDMTFSAVLASVQSGKCDIAAASLAVSEERSKVMLFSKPHFETGVVLVVRTSADGEHIGFLQRIGNSFEKTFLDENRYQLFLAGIGNTILISILSVLFGTALGFLVYLLCRRGGRFTNGVTAAAIWIVQAMPVLVLLMVLYYLIFDSVSISGVVVAVIGFTISFGASVYGMLCSGVNAVDKGQTEGAYALGVSSRQTFFDIVLPQAIPHILPSYKGEVGALIKGTSIVGYIAVQDLTKMGDIVRGRTYEAFFPLVAVAVIYIILAVLLNLVVGKVIDRIDPRKRSREAILKGVDTHD